MHGGVVWYGGVGVLSAVLAVSILCMHGGVFAYSGWILAASDQRESIERQTYYLNFWFPRSLAEIAVVTAVA